jgi:hypothetical protein
MESHISHFLQVMFDFYVLITIPACFACILFFC